ncbi:unnamed protein product [Aphanomyces euteiches]|uniref:Uncharacterized protein n=1 Tax=Aphanomyces euteiches TaxID=100861 RepID=A0A6G0WX35_9STRA|nr:hypothetical protein Ae201684_010698 [Aphanomyces euteiches]KAH9061647.1 hypothetical protein Ae201684P_020982 [Aphanomyces euteiches]KAH9140978.1 hypothetical protein AeRB84_014804 [Aphanomyces euteiches]
MNQADVGDDGDLPIPHYMLPNFSSILPEYANAEAEHIKSAFSTGNYTSILKMPSKLAPNAVSQARQDAMDDNRRNIVPRGPPKLITKNGVFNQFEYTSSRYSLADELLRAERLESEAKRLEIGGKDFICSSGARKLKYEDGFEDKDYIYPHMPVHHYDAVDTAVREKWIQDKKILYGPFVPSGTTKVVGAAPTRKMLPDILKELNETIMNDWEDAKVVIAPTEDGNIAVRFDVDTVGGVEHAVAAYMNVLCNNHRITTKYSLQKVVEDWNTKPGDNGLYFVFRPPWIRNPLPESFMDLYDKGDKEDT